MAKRRTSERGQRAAVDSTDASRTSRRPVWTEEGATPAPLDGGEFIREGETVRPKVTEERESAAPDTGASGEA